MGSAPEFDTLVDLFTHAVASYGPRDLFGTKQHGAWTWITYAQFADMVGRMRRGLAALGVTRGDKVAIIANNRVEWAVTAYATYGLGAVLVPMYEAQSGGEWEFIVADSEAKVLVLPRVGLFEKAPKLLEGGSALRHAVLLDGPEAPGGSSPVSITTYEALLRRDGAIPDPVQPGRDELSTLIYTSGTTGTPKGVMLSHYNIASNVNAIHKVLVLGETDRSLAFLPWAHVFGQTAELHHLFSAGASIAICESPGKILDNLGEIRPTIIFSVPTVFNRLYVAVQQQIAARPAAVRRLVTAAVAVAQAKRAGKAPNLPERLLLAAVDRLIFSKVRQRFGGRLRYCSAGGAALAREVGEFISAIGIVVFEGYGATETSPVVSTNYPGVHKMGTVGPAIPGVRVVIDTAAGAGEPGREREGEIIVYGPNVMKGYYKRPEETAAVFTPDGGFRTGDMGFVDGDGFLSITGRIKEQYKLENGKYVVPTALEEQLKLSPYVANVMVYGDNRPHNVALVVPNLAAVKKWAEERQITLPGDAPAIVADDRVRALFREDIVKHAASFKSFEVIREFALLTEDFTTENGLLTPKMSLKRRQVIARYRDTLDRLYTKGSRHPVSDATAA